MVCPLLFTLFGMYVEAIMNINVMFIFHLGDDCFYRSCISFCRMWSNMTKLPRVSTRLTSLIFCSISSLWSLIHHTQLVSETCFWEYCHLGCDAVQFGRFWKNTSPFLLQLLPCSSWLPSPYTQTTFSTLGSLCTLKMETAHCSRTLVLHGLHGVIPEDNHHSYYCESLRFHVFVKPR